MYYGNTLDQHIIRLLNCLYQYLIKRLATLDELLCVVWSSFYPSPQVMEPNKKPAETNATNNNVQTIIFNKMNYHPTIPTLSLTNMAPWYMEIHCEAEEMGITNKVMGLAYTPEPYGHRSVSSLTGDIIASFPTDIAETTITPGIPINPARLTLQIQRHHSTQSEADQQAI